MLKNTKYEVLSLRKKLKLFRTKHTQINDFGQVEKEKLLLIGDLVDRNKDIVILKEQLQNLQQSIKENVCTIVVLAESDDPSEKLT